jgi:hypothetical protein
VSQDSRLTTSVPACQSGSRATTSPAGSTSAAMPGKSSSAVEHVDQAARLTVPALGAPPGLTIVADDRAVPDCPGIRHRTDPASPPPD